MKYVQIPVWLISLIGVLAILIVLERLYVAKVPVKIWGIELNQPPPVPIFLGGGLILGMSEEVTATKKNNKALLNYRQGEALCFLTYVGGKFSGDAEAASVHLDNGNWVVQAYEGAAGADVMAKGRCLFLSVDK